MTSLSLWSASSLLSWQLFTGHWNVFVLLGALVLLLFIAEVVPLLLAAGHAEQIALRGARFVEWSQTVLRPLTWIIGGVAFGLARGLGSGPRPKTHVTENELRTALAAAEEEGTIESGERALIEGAMDLRTQSVREVMTPRLDIVGVAANLPLTEVLDIALREGHSRLPIYEGSLDKIIGVLATKDLLPHLRPIGENGIPKVARDVARPALFVPETGRVNVVLDELRRNRTLLAVVVDASGTTAGLVTLEDLLEELVGEIQDEYDAEEAPVRLLNEAEVQAGAPPLLACDAGSSVRELGAFLRRRVGTFHDASRRERRASRVGDISGGSGIGSFGKVPQVGNEIEVGQAMAPAPGASDVRRPTFEVWFCVSKMEGPRLLELQVKLVPETEAPAT